MCEKTEPEALCRSIHSLLTEANIGIDEDWDSYSYWVALLSDELIGCISLVHAGRVAILHSLAVKKAHRHRGIGTELLKRQREEARTNGAEVAVLMTMFWNVNFCRKLGFETTSRKLLPDVLKGHPMIYDPSVRRCTPMILSLR